MLTEAILAAQTRRPTPPRTPAPLPIAISLTAKTAAGESRVTVLPKQEPSTRPLALIQAGEKPQLRWSVRNNDAKAPVKDIVVHFLILREEAAGEKIAAGLRKGSVLDQVMGTTLRPQAVAGGNYNTAIYEPGFYLVEVEVLDPDGNRRLYAALDLEVRKP